MTEQERVREMRFCQGGFPAYPPIVPEKIRTKPPALWGRGILCSGGFFKIRKEKKMMRWAGLGN
jgi:hypothetical protein